MNGDKLKAGAKELFIDTYLEFFPDEVVAKLQKFLAPLTPEDLRQCVADSKAPPLPAEAVEELKGYEDYLERLKPEELFEWLGKARLDLADTLASLGDQGAEYVVKLKSFIVDSIRNPEGAPTKTESQMVKLHCDACGADWTLPKNLAEKVAVCPFCRVGREEETET